MFDKATFTKQERLKSKKTIAEIIEKGTSFSEYPFRFSYVPTTIDSPYPAQVCIAVPKRRVALANQRNTIKRRMREAWRLNKHLLYHYLHAKGTQIALMVIYIGKGDVPFAEMQSKMPKALMKFQQVYESHQPPA